MSVVAAVITGAQPEYAPLIKRFARDLLGEKNTFAFIQHPKADEALGRAYRLMSPEQQFAVRDEIQTQARQAQVLGARKCVIVAAVAHNEKDEGFGICMDLVRRERAEVTEWYVFREIAMACLTPDRSIVPVPALS